VIHPLFIPAPPLHTGMTIESLALIVACLAGTTAALIRAYEWTYHRGYSVGHHVGFTEGLYRHAERTQRQKKTQIARKLVSLSV
jgi:hypothetical protein